MGIVKVITDFDNTVTEEKGLEPFFEAYSRLFCKELGILEPQYRDAISTVRRDMEAQPLKYGWKHNRFFSTPVAGDPIGSNTVAHIELMHRIMNGDLPNLQVANVPADESAVLDLKEKCYLEAYPQRHTFFREGAAGYLNALANMFPGNAAIMSNSKDTAIREKLDGLAGLDANLHLIGSTRKMVVGSEKGQVQPNGFPVPVNPDRPEYLGCLMRFHPNLNELAVIGDNFFLDVATVLLHGGYGVLLETEVTQGYEIPFLEEHPRGHFARNYDSALQFLEQHRES